MSLGDRISDALTTIAACVADQVDDICTATVMSGDQYVDVRPSPDSECEDELCSKAWVRVTGISPSSTNTNMGGGYCGTEFAIQLEVGVLRCYDIAEEGEAPDSAEMLMTAIQTYEDMGALACALQSCEEWSDSITLGAWSPVGPRGGQYGGTWSATLLY